MPLCEMTGTFYRSVPADRADRVLEPPTSQSAGRYHRHGQPALYMSPSLDWARTAVSGYMREDMKIRFVFPVEVTGAQVFDQRSQEAYRHIGLDPELSSRPWRAALKEGKDADSWLISDRVRGLGADGLIDLSRHIPGGWHLVLFRWNALGGPRVRVSGDPATVHPRLDGPKWS